MTAAVLDAPARVESWRLVPEEFGRYEVSDCGRVRNALTGQVLVGQMKVRRRRRVDPVYRRVQLRQHGRSRNWTVGRLVLLAFAGPPEPGQEMCHGPGGSLDDRWPENLRWDTKSENTRDQVRDGTHHYASRTHCPQGHLLVAPNLVASKLRHGWRNCLACARGRSAVYIALHRHGQRLQFEVVADEHYAEIMATVDA